MPGFAWHLFYWPQSKEEPFYNNSLTFFRRKKRKRREKDVDGKRGEQDVDGKRVITRKVHSLLLQGVSFSNRGIAKKKE